MISQLHVDELETLDPSRLDPSLALAFYFRDRTEFEIFCSDTRIAQQKQQEEINTSHSNITYNPSSKTEVIPPPPLYYVQHAPPSFTSGGWMDDDDDDNQSEDDRKKGIGNVDDDEYILV